MLAWDAAQVPISGLGETWVLQHRIWAPLCCSAEKGFNTDCYCNSLLGKTTSSMEFGAVPYATGLLLTVHPVCYFLYMSLRGCCQFHYFGYRIYCYNKYPLFSLGVSRSVVLLVESQVLGTGDLRKQWLFWGNMKLTKVSSSFMPPRGL